MNASDQATPGMRFPPPVAFGAGLALGFLLQHFVPFTLVGPSSLPLLRLLGGGFILTGATLAASALITFRLAHTTVRPDRPAAELVTHGPFRLSRNPMYVSLALVQAGIALLANALWPLLLLLPALLLIRYHVIAREETYLVSRFGHDYQAYCQSVRRWL
ncbi:MAG TPA: isoprenylcysteine carboxylmethyltransferase family protein [Geothrix sp.]